MKPKLCFVYQGAFPIYLVKVDKEKYIVEYGKQSDEGDYEIAARKLGEAIMHSLQCEGKLDDNGA